MPGRDPTCIFCAIVAGEAPAEVLDEDEHTVTLMDINPATKGHALVIPREHSEDLLAISEEDLRHTAVAAQRIAKRMERALEPDGFNLINACRVAAWQTVFHFHIHVIPRYEDDPLKLPWIPRGADMDEIASIAATIRNGGQS
ncbi:MAG: HIT family protein [Solirubrobacterales bacterium]|nr:HIT family protein [Solirubrobacterales bacterium]MCB8970640.1 HIT family protein [Thermoleophilales bacterium]MCO5326430.1 HIT family protein [Solirubrobacterales bacterium]